VDCETVTISNTLEACRRPGVRWCLLCLLVVCSGLACTHQPRLTGPTAPSGYFFTVQVAEPTIEADVPPPEGYGSRDEAIPVATELIVRVQDTRGQPVDGVPVEFQVEPAWTSLASVSPPRAITNSGTARTVFAAQGTGIAHVRVRVENTTQEATITVTIDMD
jgi:hypothetical protein